MNPLTVTVIIVARNEARYIVSCLESVKKQFDAGDKWELLLVDGNSTDGTLKLAAEYLDANSFNYAIINNPGLFLASGWNLGINHAKGEFVIRPDAHARLGKNYIRIAMGILELKQEVAAVGGILNTCATSATGKIIREALSMKTGVGNSSFRIGAPAGYYDTVVYGLYRRSIFDEVGLFNEMLVRHQDTEMHSRIRQSGKKFYMDPGISAEYYCRDSIRGLLSQMHNIGFYFSHLVEAGALSSLSYRHKLPFLFYATLFLLLAVGLIIHLAFYVAAVIFMVYLSVIAAEAVFRAFSKMNGYILFTILIIPLMHVAYAWGTFKGSIRLLNSNKNES
ncbi:MAG: glycosyltransferase family 2 protein [Bacteroidota bacterium]|nr:glycosyltransferase family 2 protein [Bacteroidota bacterium]